jgi:preprotein translocase subunit Sss1
MSCRHQWYSLLDGSTICPLCKERRPSIYQFTHPYRRVSSNPQHATIKEFLGMIALAALIGFVIGFIITMFGW